VTSDSLTLPSVMVRPRPWRRLDIGELRSPLSTYATECPAAKRLTRRLEHLSLASPRRAVSASVGPVAARASASAKAARET
jgi:hypothetical protein